ncbi:hypothetical protein GOP47_0021466 [Adiantum capillus-veneris]|uniref:Uncharacterized protein n=1 Tax=Adiantum capillus-veneris TaxID=13818 RepID=A0A9D4Z6A2_ADICA|nr:hypothetical protein GOP47_0021466 [Adiantum capillus-veneris]
MVSYPFEPVTTAIQKRSTSHEEQKGPRRHRSTRTRVEAFMAALSFLPSASAIEEVTSKESVWKPPWLQPQLLKFDPCKATYVEAVDAGIVRTDSSRQRCHDPHCFLRNNAGT